MWKSGIESEGQTEIRNGLEAGQKVVVSGQFLIDSEASLRGTATRMGDAPVPQGGDGRQPDTSRAREDRAHRQGRSHDIARRNPIVGMGADDHGFQAAGERASREHRGG